MCAERLRLVSATASPTSGKTSSGITGERGIDRFERTTLSILPQTVKNRLHLDVRAAPGLQGEERMATLETECERLVALGATRQRRVEPEPPMEAGFIVMADPESNEFCLD